jgi:conjugative relaxase-like TrwC/TraI family protein
MTINRLRAGSGYRYLTRTTARGDTDHAPSTSLTAYYTATGTPPGRWHGTGLAGLADGAGIPAGAVVDEAAMAALFGTGHDPVTGAVLGRAYPEFTTAVDRVAARMARLPAGLTLEQRATLSERFTVEETARPNRHAVAGFDLTFTAPKSVSVLWALADPATQAEIVTAHHAAVADTLTVLESQALFTRLGAGSCAQVTTGGAVAAGFDHPDTRTGDPNLHTHLVLANKVQGPDGAWRSVDSRALYTAAVALSETYDSLLADHLTRRLGVTWGWRDRGPNRSPAHELTAISDDLLAVFSTRSVAITTAVAQMIRDHVAATGTRPSRRQVLKMRQHATLATRPDKTTHTLPEQMTTWRHRAATVIGGHGAADVLRAALGPGQRGGHDLARRPSTLLSTADVDDAAVASLAGDVLAALIERRSTWTRWNTLAETARTTRHLRLATAADRVALHDRVVTAALAACTRIDPTDPVRVPAAYQRPDGASVFTRAGTTRYTHPLVLAAEQRLLDAHTDTTAPTALLDDEPAQPTAVSEPVAAEAVPVQRTANRPPLAADQAGAVRIACTSGRRVEVLIGPAGSGKTTTLRALRHAWEHTHGLGSVIGLAPSATAARTLADSLAIPCENTAKWLYESTPRLDGSPRPIWRMRAGQLIIIDEASLASTATLDALRGQALALTHLKGPRRRVRCLMAKGPAGCACRRWWPTVRGHVDGWS